MTAASFPAAGRTGTGHDAALFRLLVEHTSDVVIRLDRDFVRTYVSPSSLRVLGYEPDEMVGAHPRGVVHPEDWPRTQALLELSRHSADPLRDTHRCLHRDGHLVWLEGCYSAVADGGFVVLLRDITERRQAEQRLEAVNAELVELASRDPLTGVSNRRRFDEMLAAEGRRASGNGSTLSLLLADVDRFKPFNDRYGHQAGDRCLRAVAGAVAQAAGGPADLVARYGGEEFVVLLPDTDEAGAAVVADRVCRAVRRLALPHEHGRRHGGIVTVSLGCASADPRPMPAGCPVAEATADLVGRADRALYEAKRRGRDRVVRWSDHPVEPVVAPAADEAERLAAVERCRDRCGTLPAVRLDRLAEMAARLLGMPMGFISLVERERVLVAGRHNVELRSVPRQASFCTHAMTGTDALVVADAEADPRFRNNPLVAGENGMRFYAGMPLLLPDGALPVGALCVADTRSRSPLDGRQRDMLSTIAEIAVRELLHPVPEPAGMAAG